MSFRVESGCISHIRYIIRKKEKVARKMLTGGLHRNVAVTLQLPASHPTAAECLTAALFHI